MDVESSRDEDFLRRCWDIMIIIALGETYNEKQKLYLRD